MCREYKFRSKSRSGLNPFASLILARYPEFVSSLEKFELVEGFAKLTGSGDVEIIDIYMRCRSPTKKDLEIIDAILSLGRELFEDIEVEIVTSDDRQKSKD